MHRLLRVPRHIMATVSFEEEDNKDVVLSSLAFIEFILMSETAPPWSAADTAPQPRSQHGSETHLRSEPNTCRAWQTVEAVTERWCAHNPQERNDLFSSEATTNNMQASALTSEDMMEVNESRGREAFFFFCCCFFFRQREWTFPSSLYLSLFSLLVPLLEKTA